MRPIRRTNRPPEPPAPPPAPIDPPSFLSRAPGQHEDIIERLKNGFKEVLRMLDDIGKQRQDVKVVVELDTSVQREILEVVKRIEEKLDKVDSGLSKAEEDRLAAQLNAASSPLEVAVESNQPTGDNTFVAPKKKKKKKGE